MAIAITMEEVNTLLKKIKMIDSKVYIICVLEATTGLRISDLVGLKYSDITEEGVEIKEKKTGKKTYLAVPMNVEKLLYSAMRKFKADEDDFIFIKVYAENNKKAFIRKVQRVIKKVARDGISSHSFRKAFATSIYEENKDILEVQSILNHRSVETTMRYIGINKEKILIQRKKERIDIEKF